jgi:RNA polymerase sigma factor (sigma-70 family)
MSDDAFARHRRLLFTVAYEMLGSASDAEDVVQETWLRWADVDHASVREPRAYLVRIVTRQALNRLRTLARRREDYVGEWLPEPLVTSPDVAADVELAESLSMAMLTVLETLGPAERAVFVLREVFDTPYARSQRRSANHLPPFARSPTGLASTSLLDVHGCRSPRRAKGDSGPVPCRHPARRPAGSPRRLGPRGRCPRRRRRRGTRCSSSGQRRGAGGQPPDQRPAYRGLRGSGCLAQRVTRHPHRRPHCVQRGRERCRRGRSDHSHLRRRQPTEVGPARRDHATHAVLTMGTRWPLASEPRVTGSRPPGGAHQRSRRPDRP